MSGGPSVAIPLESVTHWSKVKHIVKGIVLCIYTQMCNTAFCVSLVWDDYLLEGGSHRYHCGSAEVGNIAFRLRLMLRNRIHFFLLHFIHTLNVSQSSSKARSLPSTIFVTILTIFPWNKFVCVYLEWLFQLQLKQTAGLEDKLFTFSITRCTRRCISPFLLFSLWPS